MKHPIIRHILPLTMAALILSSSASALFGRKTDTQPETGAPEVQPMEIQVYQGVPYQGQFPSQEELTFSIVDQPKKGTVSIEGGTFTYTPKDTASGGDSFTYAAADNQGRISAPATVTITIEKVRSGIRYSDTDGSPAAFAAQELAEAGIFTGSKIGGQYCFEPDRPVSREEFLALVLETAGRDVTAVTMTGFCDDEAIPTWAKAYAAAGVADGVVYGSPTPQGAAFRGKDPITFSEAAVVLDRVLGQSDVDLDVWYADREGAVPSWSAQAVGNMEAVSVLAAGSFGSPTMEAPVTRADAALMLTAARSLMEGQEEESSGFFGWLK